MYGLDRFGVTDTKGSIVPILVAPKRSPRIERLFSTSAQSAADSKVNVISTKACADRTPRIGEVTAWPSTMHHTAATNRSASDSLIPANSSAGGARFAPITLFVRLTGEILPQRLRSAKRMKMKRSSSFRKNGRTGLSEQNRWLLGKTFAQPCPTRIADIKTVRRSRLKQLTSPHRLGCRRDS